MYSFLTSKWKNSYEDIFSRIKIQQLKTLAKCPKDIVFTNCEEKKKKGIEKAWYLKMTINKKRYDLERGKIGKMRLTCHQIV